MKEISYDDWIIRPSDDAKPREAMIEITSRCNYSCVHCFRNAVFDETFGDMSFDLYAKVLEDLKKCHAQRIILSGWGEPLVHPMFIKFCKLAKELGFQLVVTTNGSLLHRYVPEIVEIGVDEIVLSIDSPREEAYGLLRKQGKLSTVIRALKEITAMKLKRDMDKPQMALHFTITRLNCKDIPLLPSFAMELGIEKITLSHVIATSRDIERKLSCLLSEISRKRLRSYIDKASSMASEYGIALSIPRDGVTGKRICPFVNKKAIFISWDGHVSPCIYYAHNWRASFFGRERTIYRVTFGNIREGDLMTIWKNPEFIMFKFKTRFFEYPSCLDCDLMEICSLTKSNEVDCYGNSPTCASCPYAHDIVRCPL